MAVPAEVVRAVRTVYGESAELVGVELPGDWQVGRLRVLTPGGPVRLVAKWLRSNPLGWRTDPRQQAIEAAGLGFVNGLTPGMVPQLIAAELDPRTGGVVLLEDLSPREPLDAIIRRAGVTATERARLAYARALGRLAAVTAGRDQEFRSRLAGHTDQRLRLMGPPWEQQRRTLEAFGVAVPAAAEQEVIKLQALLADPGPYLALSNCDMSENNFMIDIDDPDDHGRLIDFESAQFDHALAHAANFFVPGPCWMVVDDPIGDQLEAAFRTALAGGIPEAADDQGYRLGVAAGCVAMGFERCGNLTVMDRRPAGHPSRIQRIATLEAAADAAETRGLWGALTDVLRDLARRLRHRWPDADVELAELAPYTPRPA
ncbi:MAG: hypothetical protein J2P23_08020 [Microlunatus sp.]|nr:hypothetical protein [Microlunatus sp.]